MVRALLLAAVLAALAGCAGVPAQDPLPWRDAGFAAAGDVAIPSRDDLFRLDPELLAQVRSPEAADWAPSRKLRHLLAIVFGPDARRFNYAPGHSTTASETWRARRGDCLSLTVLTYAVGRALGMPAQMQEVDVPVLYERRDGLDYVNQHVNVLFRRSQWVPSEEAQPHDVVIDFEPEFASARAGRPLDENAVYARFLNNRAVESLAHGERAQAHAWFRAAIAADPSYAASYGNVALLYRTAGYAQEAEAFLQRSAALAREADVALHALRELMAAQGRDGEVRRYDNLLQARRTRDPYYWIETGERALLAGDAPRAVRALEQAREMTGNFAEVHALLALAYERAGDPAKAQQERAALAALLGPQRSQAKLKRLYP